MSAQAHYEALQEEARRRHGESAVRLGKPEVGANAPRRASLQASPGPAATGASPATARRHYPMTGAAATAPSQCSKIGTA